MANNQPLVKDLNNKTTKVSLTRVNKNISLNLTVYTEIFKGVSKNS